MKTIYHVEHCDYDFFFSKNGKLLHYWTKNDASFNSEYMNPLFNKLGFDVIELFYEGRFKDKITGVLIQDGLTLEDIDYKV